MNYLARLKQLETKDILTSTGNTMLPELTQAPFVSTGSCLPSQKQKKNNEGEKIIRPETGQESLTNMVHEFMEFDGMTLAEAQALAAVSVKVRPAGEWLALIAELDAMIVRYCAAAGLDGDAIAAIFAARHRQSVASIPESLEWFRRELALMATTTPPPTSAP
jgi:hypothetical protein